MVSSWGLSGILTPYHCKPRTVNILIDSLKKSGNSKKRAEMHINWLSAASVQWGLRAMHVMASSNQLNDIYSHAFNLAQKSIAELLFIA